MVGGGVRSGVKTRVPLTDDEVVSPTKDFPLSHKSTNFSIDNVRGASRTAKTTVKQRKTRWGDPVSKEHLRRVHGLVARAEKIHESSGTVSQTKDSSGYGLKQAPPPLNLAAIGSNGGAMPSPAGVMHTPKEMSFIAVSPAKSLPPDDMGRGSGDSFHRQPTASRAQKYIQNMQNSYKRQELLETLFQQEMADREEFRKIDRQRKGYDIAGHNALGTTARVAPQQSGAIGDGDNEIALPPAVGIVNAKKRAEASIAAAKNPISQSRYSVAHRPNTARQRVWTPRSRLPFYERLSQKSVKSGKDKTSFRHSEYGVYLAGTTKVHQMVPGVSYTEDVAEIVGKVPGDSAAVEKEPEESESTSEAEITRLPSVRSGAVSSKRSSTRQISFSRLDSRVDSTSEIESNASETASLSSTARRQPVHSGISIGGLSELDKSEVVSRATSILARKKARGAANLEDVASAISGSKNAPQLLFRSAIETVVEQSCIEPFKPPESSPLYDFKEPLQLMGYEIGGPQEIITMEAEEKDSLVDEASKVVDEVTLNKQLLAGIRKIDKRFTNYYENHGVKAQDDLKKAKEFLREQNDQLEGISRRVNDRHVAMTATSAQLENRSQELDYNLRQYYMESRIAENEEKKMETVVHMLTDNDNQVQKADASTQTMEVFHIDWIVPKAVHCVHEMQLRFKHNTARFSSPKLWERLFVAKKDYISANPMPLDDVMNHILQIYDSKANDDHSSAQRKGRRVRQPLAKIAFAHFLGLRENMPDAVHDLAAFAYGLMMNQAIERIHIFSRLTGCLGKVDDRELDLLIHLYQGLRTELPEETTRKEERAQKLADLSDDQKEALRSQNTKKNLQDNFFNDDDDESSVSSVDEEPDPLDRFIIEVPMNRAGQRLQEALQGVNTRHVSRIFDEVERHLFFRPIIPEGELAFPEDLNADTGEVVAQPNTSLDHVLSCVLREYTETKHHRMEQLELLFIEGDVNNDGVLTLAEFKNLIHSIDPTRTDSMILRMYSKALDLSRRRQETNPSKEDDVHHEEDVIDPKSFAQIGVLFELMWKKPEGHQIKNRSSRKHSRR